MYELKAHVIKMRARELGPYLIELVDDFVQNKVKGKETLKKLIHVYFYVKTGRLMKNSHKFETIKEKIIKYD